MSKKLDSQLKMDNDDVLNNFEEETNSSTKISEKSKKSASNKSEKTNSEAATKPAEENPPENQSTDGVAQLTKIAAKEQSKTETDTVAGQIVVPTTFAAQPITTVPPTSEMDDDQSISLAEMMGAINQLSQPVNCHINQSKDEIASLRSEIETSMDTVNRDIDTRKKKIAAVVERISC